MASDVDAMAVTGLKDRKGGLVALGVVQIIIGAFCALMVPLMLLGTLMSAAIDRGAAPRTSASMMMPGMLMYVLIAVFFIWMGIGSIKARRWARALWLVGSWLWLISGLIGVAAMFMFLPDMYEQMSRSGQMPRAVVTIIKAITLAFMLVFYVIVPSVFAAFYGRPDVKATCERRDPHVRWTDRCPLPVLAVSLLSGFSAAWMPLMGFYGWAIPLFGRILSGAAGAALAFGGLLLLGYISWGTYRLSIKAWWCAVALVTVWGTSAAITFSRVDMMAFYERMHFPAEQLEMMRPFSATWGSWMPLLMELWIAVALVYLLYVRRFFTPSGERPGGAAVKL